MDDTHHFGRLVDYVQLRVRAQPRGVEALLGLRGPSSQFSNPTRAPNTNLRRYAVCCGSRRTMDMDKAKAELEVLRAFIDFVNRQVGVYSDCLAGFQGNVVRVERQVLGSVVLLCIESKMGNLS